MLLRLDKVKIDLNDNWKLLIGGRYDDFDITVDDIKNGTSESRNDTTFSPRAGVIYKQQENVSLYLSYSESFLPRSGEQFKSLSASSARLDPDVFENTEYGVKWAISPDLSFTAAYFDSEQVRAVRDSVSGETSEVIGLTVDGFELELKGNINERMYIALGYANMDGETSTGGEPREIPDSTLTLWTNFQVTDKFGWGVGLMQQGESNISNNKPNKRKRSRR